MFYRSFTSLPKSLATALVLVGVNGAWADTDDLKIPNLGASSTSLYSEQYERRLGSLWLKVFRAQAPVLDDPLLADYRELDLRACLTQRAAGPTTAVGHRR